MRKYLVEGALAGATGGLGMGLFLLLVGERTLADAIAREANTGQSAELYSRGAQHVGGVVGAVLFGALVGVFLGFTVAVAGPRLAGSAWRRAVVVAAAGYLSLAVVPFVKYPASPPGVGDPSTIARRTELYLALLVASVLVTWLAWRAHEALRRRGWRDEHAVPIALACYLALLTAVLVWSPGSGDRIDLPAGLLWRFRIQSLGGATLLYAIAGLTLGARLSPRPAVDAEPALAAPLAGSATRG